MNDNYKVYHVILPSNKIINNIPPQDAWIKRKPDFYERLEASILKEGFRNPIQVCIGKHCWTWATKKKFAKTKFDKEAIICDRLGGSRLYVAQKHNLEIPCIIMDSIGKFDHLNPLKTPEEVNSYFKDPSEKIVFGGEYLYIRSLEPVHMNDK
jgi:hypothetical protein